MKLSGLIKRKKRKQAHPYLEGNFAPVIQNHPLTPCVYSGQIPSELHGGQYVRNGSNPVANEDLGRDAHWFDGDGMLTGVVFRRVGKEIQPEFVNQLVLTDIYLASLSFPFLQTPIVPSIATLIDPLTSLLHIIICVLRTVLLVLFSRLPGCAVAIKRISVANTGILFHDGRALATCESGPPMRVALPTLETVGWYNGNRAEGEKLGESSPGFGGTGLLSFMREWTTAHPRVDPQSGELILYHASSARPFVHYSVIPATYPLSVPNKHLGHRILNAAVPGISSAKMMHDFGVSSHHTVILDLPLSLDASNLLRNEPVLTYDSAGRSRFGVFPRYSPSHIHWFETTACCIFHTANTWDDRSFEKSTGLVETTAVNMLACRLTSASVVFQAGNISAPVPIPTTDLSVPVQEEAEQCRLYYYQFDVNRRSPQNCINHQFALSAISLEFPSMREDKCMSAAKYIYGTSVTEGTFGAALGRVAKIDCLAKINVEALIARGTRDSAVEPITGCVDKRSVREVLQSTDLNDPIKIFQFPPKHHGQETSFVPRANGVDEDDGYLLTYVFNESQLDAQGHCLPGAHSALWVIDAKDMRTVVAQVELPQRVPYGLHGNWFSEDKILRQRPISSRRGLPVNALMAKSQTSSGIWGWCRNHIGAFLA